MSRRWVPTAQRQRHTWLEREASALLRAAARKRCTPPIKKKMKPVEPRRFALADLKQLFKHKLSRHDPRQQ